MSNYSFSRTRPNSCPDPWRKEEETISHTDRARSVLEGQDNDMDNNGNNEINKAKVNQWMGSEVRSNVDSQVTNRKPFYHYQQPRGSPGLDSEFVGARAQTEPGRCRNQVVSDNIKTLDRKSVHDVRKNSQSHSHEAAQQEGEVWVVVEKSSSDINMPCDPDDESNVLVPSPSKTSMPTQEQDGGDNKDSTRMVLSNKFGSTFEVLPQISDRAAETEGGKSSTKARANTQGTRRAISSIGQIGVFAASIMKWKRQGTLGYATLDPEHRRILSTEADTIKTEVPEALMKTIKEEAYKIIIKTTQAYRSQIGGRHKLTSEAYEYLKDLKEELMK